MQIMTMSPASTLPVRHSFCRAKTFCARDAATKVVRLLSLGRERLVQLLQSVPRVYLLGIAAALLVFSATASAQLTVEIVGGTVSKIPIALSEFTGEDQLSEALTSIIKADLEQSGLFSVKMTNVVLPQDANLPDAAKWKTSGVEALATGAVRKNPDGSIEVGFRLFDTVKSTQIAAQGYHLTPGQIRATAHRIADIIYSKLTGEMGVFSTRIAYVITAPGGGYALQVADSDGYNMQPIIRSANPLMSPSWSPDGSKVAYVSFEKKKPTVYIQSLSDGRRDVLANYKGSNSSPAWAPNGQDLAVVLSKDGGQHIYLINSKGSNLRRLTFEGNNTEPVFSPDGSSIFFTSDRGGSPQIYRMSGQGGQAQRITFSGSYNAGPIISPNGKQLAYVTVSEGSYQIAVMDLASKQPVILGNSKGAERPAFSPNGRMVLFASQVNGKDVLVIASVDGKTRQILSLPAGRVREPSWGPIR